MKKKVKIVSTFISLIIITTNIFAYPIAPTGKKLSNYLDSLDVTNHWLPHRYADWKTGKTYGRYENPNVTHCSSFVAAATAKLGIYILRPPEFGLLANAQYRWLLKKGTDYGWFPVEDDHSAQKIANQGCLVVMAYHSPNKLHPGHVAIIRPSDKPKYEINIRGPQIIQAGGKNYNSASLSKGIKNHRLALKSKKMVYYGHSSPFCELEVRKA